MTLLPGAGDNTDCDLVARLWQLLNSPSSGEWYLGSIIKNGLRVPALGIDIPPFPDVAIGDIPQQTMFDWAAEHLGIAMSDTVLTGLGTFSGGDVVCEPVSGTETDVTLTLQFSRVDFYGGYDVGASGLTGCALAYAAAQLGYPPSSAGEGGDPRLELAAWYRDDPRGLGQSENGKVLVGTYYLHEDTIDAVTTAPASEVPAAGLYRQVLSQQKRSADAVNASTAYYQQQESGEDPPGRPPEIGDRPQYDGGFKTYVYLNMAVQQMREQAGLPLEPGNEFADLQNAMAQFDDQIIAYQEDNPGEHDTRKIMEYVAAAGQLPDEKRAAFGLRGIPVHAPGSEEVVGHVQPWPVDRDRALRAHAARAPRAQAADDWFHVLGEFMDRSQELSLEVAAAFTATSDNKLLARAKSITIRIGALYIILGNEGGFNSRPGLYDQVTYWIANTPSFQDLLISKLNAGLNSRTVLDHLSDALNAGLKKLGLQERHAAT
ncbi:hypothetical protein AB0D13_13350 [Streptomyces sp. NPDC048430]|uniref:hypothetical protein n=1 Tax=Streptomyces sp. NPDC048430 TaxID=3155388 RepID=UPI0034304BAA